jgi:hypothetical protein
MVQTLNQTFPIVHIEFFRLCRLHIETGKGGVAILFNALPQPGLLPKEKEKRFLLL